MSNLSDRTIGEIANEEMERASTNTDHIMSNSDLDNVSHNRFNLDILKAETGPGSIEEYQEHALNFNKGKGTARVIRGLTGILGNLNLAVVDILLGSLEVLKERKGAKMNANVGDTAF